MALTSLTRPRHRNMRRHHEMAHPLEHEMNRLFHRVSSYGAFDRLIDLPVEVDEEKAEAAFKNGILTITMPKDEIDFCTTAFSQHSIQ